MKFDTHLLARLQQALPSDPEFCVKGRFFTCDFLLASGEHRFILHFRDGELKHVLDNPHPTTAWHFAIKASEEVWGKFLEKEPPAPFHDVWAAAWLGHMVLEGDMKVFMQNYYAVWRTLGLVRELANVSSTAA